MHSEYAMVDVKRSIAGTCDMILRHKKDKTRFAIADIKTKNNAYGKSGNPIIPSQKNYSAQLGGYINLFNLTSPLIKIKVVVVQNVNRMSENIMSVSQSVYLIFFEIEFSNHWGFLHYQ